MNNYDHYIVAFSGGKDSIAVFLHLLEIGIPKSKIELWHHCIDGKGETFMDWPVTEDYCRKFAEAFGVKIYFSWKTGGFLKEMTRTNEPTSSTRFEYPQDNLIECGLTGGKGPLGTRNKFPQVSANLSVRWCSAYLKIDVGASAVRNQKRFDNKRILFITGERAEESSARAKYKTFEIDRADNRNGKRARLVDHWRPVHAWPEKDVWGIMEKYKVVAHPAYYLGWPRLSCMKCIFGSPNQWASVKHIDRSGFQRIFTYERIFGLTIRRDGSIIAAAKKGKRYPATSNKIMVRKSRSKIYYGQIFSDCWELPSGAYGENAGPT